MAVDDGVAVDCNDDASFADFYCFVEGGAFAAVSCEVYQFDSAVRIFAGLLHPIKGIICAAVVDCDYLEFFDWVVAFENAAESFDYVFAFVVCGHDYGAAREFCIGEGRSGFVAHNEKDTPKNNRDVEVNESAGCNKVYRAGRCCAHAVDDGSEILHC